MVNDMIFLDLEAMKKNVKKVRRTKDMTQKEMADFLGWPFSTYQRFEGMNTEPTKERLYDFIKKTGVKSDEIMVFQGSQDTNKTINKQPPIVAEPPTEYMGTDRDIKYVVDAMAESSVLTQVLVRMVDIYRGQR